MEQNEPKVTIDEAIKNVELACRKFQGDLDSHVLMQVSLKTLVTFVNEKRSLDKPAVKQEAKQ